jgi:hypothetical protein
MCLSQLTAGRQLQTSHEWVIMMENRKIPSGFITSETQESTIAVLSHISTSFQLPQIMQNRFPLGDVYVASS